MQRPSFSVKTNYSLAPRKLVWQALLIGGDEMNSKQIEVGCAVEIKPAYSMDTGSRSIWDEIAGCAAIVVSVRGAYADVEIKGRCRYEGDYENVHIDRLKRIARM